ncbi:MAG: TonB-dependent receptor, partial [Bacteroidetes bacterium SW_11_45_7]
MRLLPVLLIFLLMCSVFVNAQERTIEGKVIDDETEEPLVNANVLVKGKNKGTVTDVQGKFSLSVKESDKVVLTISYVGYEETEKTITDFTQDYTISLAKTSIPGREVVVTASKVSES